MALFTLLSSVDINLIIQESVWRALLGILYHLYLGIQVTYPKVYRNFPEKNSEVNVYHNPLQPV